MVNLHIIPGSLAVEGPISWEQDEDYPVIENCKINGQVVAWIQRRPEYCDRGHWCVNANIPCVDDADGFPRYYMRKETAKDETERWLKWRLWKQPTRC